jgi:hypothetical protein
MAAGRSISYSWPAPVRERPARTRAAVIERRHPHAPVGACEVDRSTRLEVLVDDGVPPQPGQDCLGLVAAVVVQQTSPWSPRRAAALRGGKASRVRRPQNLAKVQGSRVRRYNRSRMAGRSIGAIAAVRANALCRSARGWRPCPASRGRRQRAPLSVCHSSSPSLRVAAIAILMCADSRSGACTLGGPRNAGPGAQTGGAAKLDRRVGGRGSAGAVRLRFTPPDGEERDVNVSDRVVYLHKT